jgi:hypothetical protein
MPEPQPGPAEKLAELLETAPPEVRREITAWLLCQPRPAAPVTGEPWVVPPHLSVLPRSAGETAQRVRQLAESLPTDADQQMVTLRLPATRHAALRAWCAEHGFSMAAVVRGLVERFLEEQTA